jgi:acetyl esterase/lipase
MPAKLPGRVTVEEHLVFGTGGGRNLTCDVFTPPDERSDRPAVLILHGGGWQNGDKSQLRGYGIQLARYGFLCVASEYRLSQEAVWPAQIEDVKAALRWLRANAQRLGVDPEKIAVTGNSAGAHLALMVGATPDVEVFEGVGGNQEVSSACAGVVAVYPPTLLRTGDISGAVAALFGSEVSEDKQDAASPLTYAHKHFPPTMLIHGNADEVVPVEASFAMYRALADAGAAVELHIYDGAPHAFDALPEFGHQLTDLMALFLDRKVVSPRAVEFPEEQPAQELAR